MTRRDLSFAFASALTDALARRNGNAGVAKLPSGERRAHVDAVFFDVAAQDLLDDQPLDIHFATFKLRDSQF